MSKTPNSSHDFLDQLVGTWATEATQNATPGVAVHGTVVVEWLEGRCFLMHRARNDHLDFPDAYSVISHIQLGRADDASDHVEEASTSPLQVH